MGFSAARLFETLARHQLLSQVVVGGISAPCGFVRPDVLQMQDGLQQAQYVIEIETGKFPALAHGQAITVDGVAYQVRGHPRRTGDGFYSLVDLVQL
jgi:hypothetical protein